MTPAPAWKKTVAFVIDIFLSFLVLGYAVGYATGNVKDGAFSLNGGPALLVLVLIVAYFYLMNHKMGGTIGKKLLGIGKK